LELSDESVDEFIPIGESDDIDVVVIGEGVVGDGDVVEDVSDVSGDVVAGADVVGGVVEDVGVVSGDVVAGADVVVGVVEDVGVVVGDGEGRGGRTKMST
jgi:hypothetical protein